MPDSVVNGRSVYEVRKRMGRRLAQESGVAADVVVPVPDSGVPAALGYRPGKRHSLRDGHHPQPLSSAAPSSSRRRTRGNSSVRMKLSPNREVLAGKRVMLIDDSIVRGTNSVRVVRMVREAGAREVHLRSASPPITVAGLLRHRHARPRAAAGRQPAACRRWTTSWRSTASPSSRWTASTGPWTPGRAIRSRPQFTDHYFTGDYPTRLLDREIAEARNETAERQLSFLVDA